MSAYSGIFKNIYKYIFIDLYKNISAMDMFKEDH